MKYVELPGHASPIKELGSRGFKVVGETLIKRGVNYHLPRSVKRAIAAFNNYGWTTTFKFVLKEDESLNITSTKEKGVGKGFPIYSTLICDSKTKAAKYVLTDNAVSFYHNGVAHQSSRANPMFDSIIKALNANDMEKAIGLVNIAHAIEKASDGLIVNDGGTLKHDGIDLNDTVTNWLTANMGRKDGSVQAVINFLAKCKDNPEKGSIDMLWRFIKKNGLVLFHDGDFLGYRYVNDELKDCHTGTFDNTPGKVCKMKREDVTYDPASPCSVGLHVGTWQHVSGSSNIVEVRVNPKDVVSVPNGEVWKMRVCKFTSWKLLRHKGVEKGKRTEHFVTL